MINKDKYSWLILLPEQMKTNSWTTAGKNHDLQRFYGNSAGINVYKFLNNKSVANLIDCYRNAALNDTDCHKKTTLETLTCVVLALRPNKRLLSACFFFFFVCVCVNPLKT